MTATTPAAGAPLDAATIEEGVRSRYGSRAAGFRDDEIVASCCGTESSCCAPQPTGRQEFSAGLYAADELDGVPLVAELAALGCGNPHALADLHPGERVLDLGSGGGIDVIIAARRVSPDGKAFGVDLTPEMVELARENAAAAGADNTEFLEGSIQDVPLPDGAVDVVMSNCAINLATDKPKVFAEISRVLRPGGRVAVADVVIEGDLPDVPLAHALRRDIVAWGSCLAGALTVDEYTSMLRDAGFESVGVEVVRRYETSEILPNPRPDWAEAADPAEVDEVMHHFVTAFIRADKPS